MVLLYLILLVVGFFFPPAWLVFAGIWIYRFASRKSRRAEAMEKILKAMVRTRRDDLDVPSLYFEWARAYAIDKGGGTNGEEDSASVTVVIEKTPYFVVFCRTDPAKPGFTISITEHDRLRDDAVRFANGQTERFAEDMEKKIASIFGRNQGGNPSSSSESSPMGDRSAPARTAFIGMMDIDDFDAINEKLGRGAGDQVMKAYKRLAAMQSKVGSILNETGFMALQDELARTGAALNEFVLCFPYSSGDEFIIQHQDPEKVRSVLESMQRAADELELAIAIPDDSGATVALLHGIPVSIGCGSTKDEAWKALIAQKRTGTKKAMSDRIELLNPPPDPPSADGGTTAQEQAMGEMSVETYESKLKDLTDLYYQHVTKDGGIFLMDMYPYCRAQVSFFSAVAEAGMVDAPAADALACETQQALNDLALENDDGGIGGHIKKMLRGLDTLKEAEAKARAIASKAAAKPSREDAYSLCSGLVHHFLIED